MPEPLQEGRDFTIDADGNLVWTAYYLLQRDECCGSGCRHCPFNYRKVNDTMRDRLQRERRARDAGTMRA